MSDDAQPGGPPTPPEGSPTPPPFGGPPPPAAGDPPVFLPQGTFMGVPPGLEEPEPALPAGGADGWTVRTGLMAGILGFVGAQFAIVVIAVFYLSAGGEMEDPAFIMAATLAQAVVFGVAAVAVARMTGPVSARDFGLVRARLAPTAGKTVFVAGVYFALLAAYAALVHLTPDDAPEKLGAGDGTLGMIGFVFTAALVAPVAEEFFFRGLVFRALSNGMGVVVGALVSGLFFGALHISSLSEERLLQVVPLALLGVLFALLYAWSGTLYAPIALHATNNSLAVIVFANDEKSTLGIVVGAAVWASLMIFCLLGWRLTDRRRPPVAPVAPENPMAPHGWG